MILISANAEWNYIRKQFPLVKIFRSPFGESFFDPEISANAREFPIIYFHGGWGKVAAAASTQYVIDNWRPGLVINLGTCGGFRGDVTRGEIILATKTIIYDIYEQMGDPEEHIRQFTTELDTSWLSERLTNKVKRALLVSGDRDLLVEDIPHLKSTYQAIAGDWESGAIAWVADKNLTRCAILRGVTDLVGNEGGEAYLGNIALYHQNTEIVMGALLDLLPQIALSYKELIAHND